MDVLFQTVEDQKKEEEKKKDGETKESEKGFTRLGHVSDGRVGRLLWLLYLGGKNVSSEEARKRVVEGCLGLVERPVGTVETRVL